MLCVLDGVRRGAGDSRIGGFGYVRGGSKVWRIGGRGFCSFLFCFGMVFEDDERLRYEVEL